MDAGSRYKRVWLEIVGVIPPIGRPTRLAFAVIFIVGLSLLAAQTGGGHAAQAGGTSQVMLPVIFNLPTPTVTPSPMFTALPTNTATPSPASSAANPWPMQGHDASRRGASPIQGPLSANLAWQVPQIYPSLFTYVFPSTSPVVAKDGMIYLGSMGYLVAINRNGQVQWIFQPYSGIQGLGSTPALGSDGTIYENTVSGGLVAVNPDGSLKWNALPGGYGSPTVGTDGTIYTDSNDGYLNAFTPTGTLKWQFSVTHATIAAIGPDGSIYFGSGNYLYALRPDGSMKWRYLTEGPDPIQFGPSVGTDGTVYVGSGDSYVYAVNSNGDLTWRYKTGFGVTSTPAIAPDGTIYVGSYDFNLYALHSNGTLDWKFQGNGYLAGYMEWTSPVIGPEGTIYVGAINGHTEYALNPDGSVKWQSELSVGNNPPAIGNDGTLYVPTGSDNMLAAFQP